MTIKKPDVSKRIDLYQYLIKYQNPTIAEMITSEQAVRNWDVNQRFLLLAQFLDAYEDYFDKHHIDIIMKFPTCSFAGRAAYAVAKRRNIPALIINTGPIITDTFTLNDIDEGWIWAAFFAEYDRKKVIRFEEKKFVDEAIDKIMLDKEKSIKVKKANIKAIIFTLLLHVYHRCKGELDYVERNEIIKEILFLLGRMRPPVEYFKIDKSKPYIFFPLHIPWDAQIATRNSMFISQETVIEMLARSCPPGVDLYVKEHPYYAGGVNKRMLKNTKKFQMIKIVDPSISSVEMIRSAKVVVTINSTAGWEAILLKKPLVVLGSPFYAYFKHAYKVENINQLPKVLNEAICKGDSIYNDTNEWYDFLYSVVSSSHKGSMIFYKNYMGLGKDLGNERIKLLANELEKEIRVLTINESQSSIQQEEVIQKSKNVL